jgi:beta-phosphoglucomutase-like phosphatase (HAD superfamily)
VRPALLFDLDGTLVHTDHLHFEAFRELRARDGQAFTMAEFKSQVLGRPNEAIFRDYYPDLTLAELQERWNAKEVRVRSMIADGVVLPPTAGLLDLLDWADKHAVPYAIVTNAPPENAALMLSASGLDRRFDIIVSGETLPQGKPHPLPYQEGLRLTGGDPMRSYAFEDSIAGLRSAVAAGILCAGIGDSSTAPDLQAAGASLVARDFTNPALRAAVAARLSIAD